MGSLQLQRKFMLLLVDIVHLSVLFFPTFPLTAKIVMKKLPQALPVFLIKHRNQAVIPNISQNY